MVFNGLAAELWCFDTEENSNCVPMAKKNFEKQVFYLPGFTLTFWKIKWELAEVCLNCSSLKKHSVKWTTELTALGRQAGTDPALHLPGSGGRELLGSTSLLFLLQIYWVQVTSNLDTAFQLSILSCNPMSPQPKEKVVGGRNQNEKWKKSNGDVLHWFFSQCLLAFHKSWNDWTIFQ